MHLTRRPARPWRAPFVLAALALTTAVPAHALRIVNYNLTNYPGSSVSLRNPKFRTIMAPLGADVVVSQEVTSQAGVDSFRTKVLNELEPGQWASAPFTNGNDTDNALFYKPAKLTFLGGWSFYPSATNLRLVNVYRLKPVGYTASAAEIRIYSCHLKASLGSESARLAEAVGIRDSMNAVPPGTHAILCGDFNIYTGAEAAFGKFLESQADNDGRLYDPLGLSGVGWDNNGTYAAVHTQCPCLNNCPTGFGFAGGGMDSRFDMYLPTLAMNNGAGLELLVSTYKPVGNDALHFNKDLNATPVIPEGQIYADALVYASDHLPVRVDFQVPAKITVASALAFGTVIVGGPASQLLTVTNAAVAPADGLDYSFAAPAGFTAPGGSFTLAAGGSAPSTITMSTAAAGPKSGPLTVASDDPDHLTSTVDLSGTVLRHASASLDSLAALTATTLDFGDHQVGGFTDSVARVHNRGYDALQARLSVSSGVITGGAGRFSIVGGFSPALVAGPSSSWSIHFEDVGATLDSTYTATLTFSSTDEPLPGAASQPALVVSLRARPLTPTDVVGAVFTTRLHAAFPNPPVDAGTTLRFDLARASDVSLEAFDVAGRRVAQLASGPFAGGAHRITWDGRGDDGRPAGAGVYFVRLTIPGLDPQTVRVTMLR